MSYTDDEEVKIGDLEAPEEDDVDLDADLEITLDDDLIAEDDDPLSDEFADLDGSSY